MSFQSSSSSLRVDKSNMECWARELTAVLWPLSCLPLASVRLDIGSLRLISPPALAPLGLVFRDSTALFSGLPHLRKRRASSQTLPGHLPFVGNHPLALDRVTSLTVLRLQHEDDATLTPQAQWRNRLCDLATDLASLSRLALCKLLSSQHKHLPIHLCPGPVLQPLRTPLTVWRATLRSGVSHSVAEGRRLVWRQRGNLTLKRSSCVKQ